jgi:plasmid maintenance system killer protein
MIRGFKSEALAELWFKGATADLPQPVQKNVIQLLRRLNSASSLRNLAEMGIHFSPLAQPGRYGIDIAPPWRLTFSIDLNVYAVHLERRP